MMSVNKQLKTLKENWLLVLALVVLVVVLQSFSSFSSIRVGFNELSDDYATKGYIGSYGSGFAPEAQDRVITYSAYISSEIPRNNLEESGQKIKDLVEKNDGVIISESVSESETSVNGYYSARVPVSNYNGFIDEIKLIGEIKNLNINSDDITQGYYSLEDELKAERSRLERFEELYTKAQTTEEKILLTDKIFDLERRISYLEESLKNTDERVDYVTVQINLFEKESALDRIDFIGVSELLKRLVDSMNSVLILLVYMIPYIILIIVLWSIYKAIKG